MFINILNAQTKDVSILLPWKHQFQFAGYYVAQELGFYEDADLNVHIVEYDLKKDNTKDVANQKYDFGVGHSSLILDKLNKHQNIMFLSAVHQSSPLILLAKKRLDISSLKDIANKTIMMSRDQTTTASINAMLSSEHLETNSYKIVDTSFKPIDLINGNADLMASYSSNEPYALSQLGIKYTIFDPKDYGYDFYSDILFTSTQLIKEDPKTVNSFYRATMYGWIYAYEHIDETVEIILKHYNTQNRTKEALLFEAQTLKKLAFQNEVPFGDINARRLKEMANTYKLLGLVEGNKKIDFKTFIYQVDPNLQNIDFKGRQEIQLQERLKEAEYIKKIILMILVIIIIAYFLKRRSDKVIMQTTEKLDKSTKIFDTHISSSKTDINGVIISVSKAFCEESGFREEELLGATHKIIKDPHTDMSVYKEMWETITHGYTWNGELKNIRKDGTAYWVNSHISPIFNEHRKIIAYEAIRQNITYRMVLKEFTEKLKAEVEVQTLELHEKQKYLDTIFDINHSISFVINDKHKLEKANKAFLEFVEMDTVKEFLEFDYCLFNYFAKDKKGSHCINYRQDNTTQRASIVKNEEEFIFNATSHHFIVNNENKYLIVLEDITKLEKLAVTDKLTGLYNRIMLDKHLDYNYASYIRYEKVYSIALLDIDLFKLVNDNYGHQVGDDVLQRVASIIKENIRSTDIVGRWGGEEFLIISPSTDIEGAKRLAEHIRIKIQDTKFEAIENLTISAGVVQVGSEVTDENILKKVDEALYRAKANGRNRVEV